MSIASLRVEQFRQFSAVSVDLHPRLTVLQGPNACGKTTLIEAMYFACRGESFRARRLDELFAVGHTGFSLNLRVSEQPAAPVTHWGVRCLDGEVLVHRFDERISRSEQARCLPIALVDHTVQRFFEDGPISRRRYLDWGLFYVEPDFYSTWRRYERALKQRNNALRQRLPLADIAAWNSEAAQWGEALQVFRASYIAQLQPLITTIVTSVLGQVDFNLELRSGWTTGIGLLESLEHRTQADLELGYTAVGPHRAELKLRLGERDVRRFSSRGQQKLLGFAMILAQATLVGQRGSGYPLLLVDDLEAELSTEWQEKLLVALMQYLGQSVISSLEWRDSLAQKFALGKDYAVFHVEHGTCVGNTPTPTDG